MAEPIPFPARPRAATAQGLEVHEHHFISGPRSRGGFCTFEHSHEHGDRPHTHPDTGPATYTIDRDELLRATGLKGGGQKKFTRSPKGEQLEFILRDPAANTFEVIVCDPPRPAGFTGEGGGMHAAARMALAFRLQPVVKGVSDV